MTKEREAEIRLLCRDGGTAQWWVVANELLKEIDRLRAKWQEEADLFKAYKEKMVSSYEMRGEEIDRLRALPGRIEEAIIAEINDPRNASQPSAFRDGLRVARIILKREALEQK